MAIHGHRKTERVAPDVPPSWHYPGLISPSRPIFRFVNKSSFLQFTNALPGSRMTNASRSCRSGRFCWSEHPPRTARKEDRIGNRSGHRPPVLSTAYPMVAHPNHDMEMKRTFQGGSPKAKGNQMYCVGREEAPSAERDWLPLPRSLLRRRNTGTDTTLTFWVVHRSNRPQRQNVSAVRRSLEKRCRTSTNCSWMGKADEDDLVQRFAVLKTDL